MDAKNVIFPLPAEKLPESWFQDERMNAMFAEFRARSVNPQDWDSKYKFWEELTSNWLSFHKKCSFSISELNLAFNRKGRTPRCLGTVIDEMIKRGEIVPEDQFLHESTWTSWAVDMVIKKPISWSLSKVKTYFLSNTPVNPDIKYVHLKTIKQLANTIVNLAKNEKEVILSLGQIVGKCSEIEKNQNINEDNVKLALIWINRSKQNKSIIKYAHSPSDTFLKISSRGTDNLSEHEEGLFKLHESEKIILKKIHDLEIEKNDNLRKAKTSVNSGLKDVTKTYLRKKRELESRIERQASTLQNIQILISNIHDAKSNSDVLAAYKKGSDILKGFEKTGLNEFNVRDTMDDIHEAIGEFSDTQNALSESFKVNTSSDAELEEELAELMSSNSPSKLLPSVPKTELSGFEKELEELCINDYPQTPITPPSISSEKKVQHLEN